MRSRELRASWLPEFQRTESRELKKAERRAEETEGEARADAASEVQRMGRRR